MRNSLLVKGIYWNLIRTVFERLILLVQQLILARLLFPEDFGVYSKITAAFSFISFFTFIGASEFLISRKKNIKLWLPVLNTYWVILLTLSIFLVGLFMKFSSYTNINFLYLVLLYSLSLPFNSFKSSDLLILNFDGRYGLVAISRILFTISLVFSSLFLAYLNYGVFSLVISYVISCFFEFLFLRFYTRIKFNFSRSYQRFKFLFLSGMKLIIHNFSWRVINSFDFFIIGYILDDIKAGLYYMAFSLAVQPISILMSYLPGLLHSSNSRDNLSLNSVIRRSNLLSFYLVFFSAPLFIYVYFYSDLLVSFFLGVKWVESIGILKILSISMIPRVFTSQWHLKYLHLGQFNYLSKVSFLLLILNIIVFCFLTFYFDLVGASIATGVFYFFVTFFDLKNFYLRNKYFTSVVKSISLSLLIFSLLRIVNEYLSFSFTVVLLMSILGFIFYFYLSILIDKNVEDLKIKLIESLKLNKQ